MAQKIKSLLYLSSFIIVAILYYKTNASSLHIDETIDTYNNHIDEITIFSFDENKIKEKGYSD